MKPRGPLMIEHRLIEKMLNILKSQVDKIDSKKLIDPVVIDIAVDFIRTYADKTHHGKEEDIMFRDLALKPMNVEEKKAMDELVDEHIQARKVVHELVEAKKRYLKGDPGALWIIKERLNWLVDFYPKHIEKEDKLFFPSTERYLNQSEQEAMLAEFWEFDRKMIHEKYASTVEYLARLE
ncbi:MAG: hemerythrin domain-containing protein [Desulfomonilaceae bacterium]